MILDEKAVFVAALDLSDAEKREDYLREACAGQPELLGRLRELLAAHDESQGPLDHRPTAPGLTIDEMPSERPGTVIGPYKLMEEIGAGGFGLVFVAEQHQPVRRKVALKVIKPGMDTREVIARFEAERQALAMMDHPHIARVFDAGTTSTGRPYFVMELVRGVPITEYCDTNNLDPKARLALFVQVCQAVQHAHQKGIIHRDLKPSNILVAPHDGVPVVKVIDFGVAKALGQSLTEKTVYTRLHQMIGTPLYMSPEQAEVNQLDVDTRSDVYSLGVLLYELLTGTTPFDRQRFHEAAFDEIRRIIKEEEPPQPSTRLTSLGATLNTVSARRGTDPARLSKLVRGELDWIVMRCLEKDRSRRYDTVAGLAKDVERYLADETVEARPVSLWYRLRKTYRRNRAVLTTATAFAGLLVVGLALVTLMWQAERSARSDADTARGEAVESAKRLAQEADLLNAANAAMDLGDFHVNFYRWADADAEYSKATKLRQDHSSVWQRRSRFYAQLGLWDLAATDSKKAFELREPDAAVDWLHNALLLLEEGDTKAYHRVCRRMLDRFGDSNDRYALGAQVFTLALAPGERGDCLKAIRLHEERVPTTGGGHKGTAAFFLGAAYYRSGQFDNSIRHLRQSLSDTTWTWRAINHPLLAMALWQQGQHDDARQELATARKVLEQWTQKAFGARNEFVPVQYWRDWVRYQQFYREAHTLIEGSAPAEDARRCVVRARALAVLGRQDRATPEYARAVRLDPKNFVIRAESFRFHCDARRWADAEADLAEMKFQRPNDSQVHVEAFRAFADHGRQDRAAAEHAAAVSLKPGDVAILLGRYRYHVERGHAAEADIAFADAIKGRAADIAFRVKCGDFCASLKHWTKARDEYSHILDAGLLGDGEINRDAWLRLASLQLYLGDAAGYRRTCVKLFERHGADADFRTAIALTRVSLLHSEPGVDPARIAALHGQPATQGGDRPDQGVHAGAILSLRMGKDDVDVSILQKALKKHQWDTQRIALARVLHARGDHHGARQHMNGVRTENRRVDPTAGSIGAGRWDWNLETQFWYQQAEAMIQSERWRAVDELVRKRQWAEAIDAFAPLLKPENKSSIDWGTRANCFAELGRWKEAAADSAQANSLSPDYLPRMLKHATVCLKVGDRAKYVEVCRRALERYADATSRDVLNNAAWICALDSASKAEAARALPLIEKALDKAPIGTHLHTHACLLYRAGRYEDALKQLNELVAQPGYPANAYDWLFLAMTHHRLGQEDHARKRLEESITWIKANLPQDWQRRAELELFREEAEHLIGVKK